MYKSETFKKGAWILEVEVDDDESHAFLSTKDQKYCASLACAEGTGCVDDSFGREKIVPDSILTWASKTAEDYGY